AAEPTAQRPEIATFAGQPVADQPLKVAQQPFAVASSGRYTYIADPVNHVVRLLLDQTEFAFAGNGGFSVEGDGGDPKQAQVAGAYAVAPGRVSRVGLQVTGFEVYVADTLNNRSRAIAPDGTISTLIGSGAARTALQIGLSQPRGLAVDASGRLWIADTGNNLIRRYNPGPFFDAAHGYSQAGGFVERVAGDGNAGYLDGVPAAQARLRQPTGMALDGQGNLYIADTGNNVIREIKGGNITTVAGNGTAAYGGEDGPATQASLSSPFGVAVRDDGDILIADTGNSYLRLVDAVTDADGSHHIHRLAGNGTPSFAGDLHAPADVQLAGPSAIVTRTSAIPGISPNAPQTAGVPYIADTFNHAIRWFTTGGTLRTLAGAGGVPGGQSTDTSRASHLSYPMGVALDASGSKLYVADTFNNQIRLVDLRTNAVSIFAGNRDGQSGSGGDGGPATSAQLSFPTGVAVDPAGDVFIADAYNARIRKVDLRGTISTVAGSGVLGYTGDG